MINDEVTEKERGRASFIPFVSSWNRLFFLYLGCNCYKLMLKPGQTIILYLSLSLFRLLPPILRLKPFSKPPPLNSSSSSSSVTYPSFPFETMLFQVIFLILLSSHFVSLNLNPSQNICGNIGRAKRWKEWATKCINPGSGCQLLILDLFSFSISISSWRIFSLSVSCHFYSLL